MDTKNKSNDEKVKVVDHILFGQRVRSCRKAKDLTIEKLAELTGLSPLYVELIEQGRKNPTIEILMRICLALDVTPNTLLIGTENKPISAVVSSIMTLSIECKEPLQSLLNIINKIDLTDNK